MGIEPTTRAVRAAGFEDQEGHQTPNASKKFLRGRRPSPSSLRLPSQAQAPWDEEGSDAKVLHRQGEEASLEPEGVHSTDDQPVGRGRDLADPGRRQALGDEVGARAPLHSPPAGRSANRRRSGGRTAGRRRRGPRTELHGHARSTPKWSRLRSRPPGRRPAGGAASAPGSSGTASRLDVGRHLRLARQVRQVAYQAEAGHVRAGVGGVPQHGVARRLVQCPHGQNGGCQRTRRPRRPA